VFELGSAFGYELTAQTHLPYIASSATTECVDDVSNPHYNTLVDSSSVLKDWSSSEQMRREDDLYHYGIFVKHNTPPMPGAGSCIFLHI
jgi:D-alanyl-D-alanine dipeptidase